MADFSGKFLFFTFVPIPGTSPAKSTSPPPVCLAPPLAETLSAKALVSFVRTANFPNVPPYLYVFDEREGRRQQQRLTRKRERRQRHKQQQSTVFDEREGGGSVNNQQRLTRKREPRQRHKEQIINSV